MGENLKAAVEVAKQASRAKSEFLSKMSHEIRTPMNAVMGMVAVAKKSDSVHHIKTCLEKIDNASTQLLGILNDILDISKIESGKFEIYLSEFRLDKTLEGLYDIISTRTNEKSQKLDFEVNFDFSRKIICDELRLTQVIMNLLTNAVKFTPEYGVIKLKLGHERSGENKERLTVEVSDTGIGLNKEQAERLFMPFEQADGSITRRFGGTGLGLAISKSIVEHLGGQISVNGVPGEGSSFKFFVEFEWGGPAFDKAEASDVPNTIHEGIWRGKKILLVEDIEVNREIVHMCLEITGVQIDDAENGVKALEIMKTRGGDYSLLLMDIQMPDMDGITCTKNLRLQGIDIPIIAMTANAFKEDVSECLSAGMSDHISKPFNFDELLSKLKCYL